MSVLKIGSTELFVLRPLDSSLTFGTSPLGFPEPHHCSRGLPGSDVDEWRKNRKINRFSLFLYLYPTTPLLRYWPGSLRPDGLQNQTFPLSKVYLFYLLDEQGRPFKIILLVGSVWNYNYPLRRATNTLVKSQLKFFSPLSPLFRQTIELLRGLLINIYVDSPNKIVPRWQTFLRWNCGHSWGPWFLFKYLQKILSVVWSVYSGVWQKWSSWSCFSA